MQTATLTRAELEAHDPGGGKGGRWLCPLPACTEHTDPRRHRSLSVVDASGLWHCHRCHAQGQLKESWKPFERKSRQEIAAQEQARRRLTIARAIEDFRQPTSVPVPVEKLRGVAARLGQLVKLSSAQARAGLHYVQGRGFTTPDALALLDAAGVRFSQTFGQREATDERRAWRGAAAVVFPVRDHQGKLTAAQGRMVTPAEGMPKCLTFGDRNRGAFATPGALEALDLGLPVAIAEAPIDALSLALCGMPALALCGCDSLPEWITRRAFNRRFLLAFDSDQPGDDAADKLAAELRGLGGMVSRLRPEDAKDFNELLQKRGEAGLRAIVEREAAGCTRLPAPAVSTVPEPEATATGEGARASHEALPTVQNRTVPQPAATVGFPTVEPPLTTEKRAAWKPVRLTDPALHAQYMAAISDTFLSGGPVPSLETWVANGKPGSVSLARAAAEADIAIGEKTLSDHWARVLLLVEQLPRIEWRRGPGVMVPDLAAWLRLKGERRASLYRRYGSAWPTLPEGRELRSDLAALTDFLSSLEASC